jgi:hypothetical protein
MNRTWATICAAVVQAAAASGYSGEIEPVEPAIEPAAIRADERDAFHREVDRLVGILLQPGDADEAAVAPAMARLDRLDVDWLSFAVRGRKNFEFPKMLLVAEFVEKPAYYAHPGNLVRSVARRPRPATNVTLAGGVPNSSFFTNSFIPSYTPQRLAEEIASLKPIGPMRITKVKKTGTTEGIWIKDETGRTYILVFDPPFSPGMTTSAEFVGSTLLRIAGYQVPKTCICTVTGTGDALYDGRRAVATLALDNFDGGWRYADFRCRREIRALQVFGGWIGNVDQTEQNTGVTVDPAGVCRHYILDFGASLGSFSFRPQMARLGWTRLFDPFNQFTQPLYNRRLRRVPWEAPYSAHSPAIGYFSTSLDPDRWQPFYTNLGFVEIAPADRVWAAERIAQFSDEQIRAVVDLAELVHASDREHVVQTLICRRDIIIRRYLVPNPASAYRDE